MGDGELERKGVSDRQMVVLEAFVAESKDAGAIAKRILIWALRKTANLTNPVHIFILRTDPAWEDFFSAGGFRQIDRMMYGASGNTHLSYFLEGMGSEFGISTWEAEGDGGHNLSISPTHFDRSLPRVTPAHEEIESIKVRHPYDCCNAKGEPFITIR